MAPPNMRTCMHSCGCVTGTCAAAGRPPPSLTEQQGSYKSSLVLKALLNCIAQWAVDAYYLALRDPDVGEADSVACGPAATGASEMTESEAMGKLKVCNTARRFSKIAPWRAGIACKSYQKKC